MPQFQRRRIKSDHFFHASSKRGRRSFYQSEPSISRHPGTASPRFYVGWYEDLKHIPPSARSGQVEVKINSGGWVGVRARLNYLDYMNPRRTQGV